MRSLIAFLFWAVRFRWLLLTDQQKDAEILYLRQQLAMVLRHCERIPLADRDRALLAAVPLSWPGWRDALAVVKPETLLQEDPIWGAPCIHSELLKLGYNVSQATVSRYLPRRPRPWARPGWHAFLASHMMATASVDFFVIPTISFRLLNGFVVLSHDRRRIVHVNVTEHPTAEWAAQQIREAFPFDDAPRFLLRDRDAIYGARFQRLIENMGIEQVVSSYRSPWQNPYCERVIGTLRRELLDHVIIVGERHALSLLSAFARFYNEKRCHLSLNKDSPEGREVHETQRGARIVAFPHVGGLHHHYERRVCHEPSRMAA